MDRTYLTAMLAEIVADLGLEAAAVREEQTLHDGLGLDSLDLVSLAIEVHERLGVTIEVADAEKLVTIGDVVDLLLQKLADRPPPAKAA